MYIESLLTDAIQRVIKGSQDHPGIETKIRARGKFELYLHLELIKEIKVLEVDDTTRFVCDIPSFL